MVRSGLACIFIALFWAACIPSVAQSNHEQLAHASVCQLKHFGPEHDGFVYKTWALYSTDFHHGAFLTDPTDTNCWVQLGVQQSDMDGSVGRFEQLLVDGMMVHGPGAKRVLEAEVVFHWVKTNTHGTFASHGKPWVPKGEVELRRVFISAPATVAPNHSPSGRAKSRAPLNSIVRRSME